MRRPIFYRSAHTHDLLLIKPGVGKIICLKMAWRKAGLLFPGTRRGSACLRTLCGSRWWRSLILGDIEIVQNLLEHRAPSFEHLLKDDQLKLELQK